MPPVSFSKWVRRKPADKNENQWFQELYSQNEWEIISDLHGHNTKEQYFLCSYCCCRIAGTEQDTVNEHVEARALAPHKSLDYNNIVASCKTKGQCDSSHQSQPLPLTPLMDECETELRFKISGRVEGITQRAIDAIRILNLGDNEINNQSLIEKRKQLSHALMWANGIDPREGLEDDELLQDVIEDLLTPKEGKLQPFSPVVANILKSWLTN